MHHLDNCQPYCTPCYKSHILRPPSSLPSQQSKTHYCHCDPVSGKLDFLMRYTHGTAYYNNHRARLPELNRPVCKPCHTKSATELLKIQEKRAKFELIRGTTDGGKKWVKCAREGCERELGTGPRWWVCKKMGCGRECTSLMHRAWGREYQGRDRVVVGGEAV